MTGKYTITYTHKFKKDLKLCQKRGYDISLFEKVSELLENTGTLPIEYSPHKLKGKYEKLWECHITPDWLLIWSQNDTELILLFTNTGTHSDLF
ncbi:type II toxin-antitoxin system YafQ family toxin [Butyricimonas paravirosa]|uniref:type II toxin-antitoxin system YafQ family toxin n=1 Tax=Butyricimonas paravirosa TaxID=1472417 RepID=UPI00210F0257|nr:type II toxin-antitoxin system YafQ family toxin [Butyricimonas paravirosa]MCQ4875409.1 type II toxin-antitoxin system YafQ family toxin [Butyricimonas paravirosa]